MRGFCGKSKWLRVKGMNRHYGKFDSFLCFAVVIAPLYMG